MRSFSAHRQAYVPRWWIAPLLAAPLGVALSLVLVWWLLIPAAGLIGYGLAFAQWWLWRHRHPALPVEVVARESARWN